MLKIQREQRGGLIYRLSGRIETDDIAELQRMLEMETPETNQPVTLDLGEVLLVDREGIRFLASCEAKCIVLETCPPYIRQWIDAERRQSDERGSL